MVESADDPLIVIEQFAFGAPITIAAGTTVTVENHEGVAHTRTARDGLLDSGVIDGGTSFEELLAEPGTTSSSAPSTPP
ncbi:MAG: hypothetical protein ACE5GB_09440 [Acidimicrobiales bacterium]